MDRLSNYRRLYRLAMVHIDRASLVAAADDYYCPQQQQPPRPRHRYHHPRNCSLMDGVAIVDSETVEVWMVDWLDMTLRNFRSRCCSSAVHDDDVDDDERLTWATSGDMPPIGAYERCRVTSFCVFINRLLLLLLFVDEAEGSSSVNACCN